MMNRLKDKVAIISGVGRRFGQASALLFAKEGAKVVLTSRSEEIIEKTSEIINKRNGSSIYKTSNATDISEVSAIAELALSKYGKVDVIVNNVGGFYTKKSKITDTDWSEWGSTLNNNIKSIFNFCKAVIPQMKKIGGGSIINISAASKTLLDSNSAYSAAKGGIISLTKNIAFDFHQDNIRVNCVCPGVVRIDANLEEESELDLRLKRKGNSEDVANAILFFASNESAWVTGQVIVVDGGESLFLTPD